VQPHAPARARAADAGGSRTKSDSILWAQRDDDARSAATAAADASADRRAAGTAIDPAIASGAFIPEEEYGRVPERGVGALPEHARLLPGMLDLAGIGVRSFEPGVMEPN